MLWIEPFKCSGFMFTSDSFSDRQKLFLSLPSVSPCPDMDKVMDKVNQSDHSETWEVFFLQLIILFYQFPLVSTVYFSHQQHSHYNSDYTCELLIFLSNGKTEKYSPSEKCSFLRNINSGEAKKVYSHCWLGSDSVVILT